VDSFKTIAYNKHHDQRSKPTIWDQSTYFWVKNNPPQQTALVAKASLLDWLRQFGISCEQSGWLVESDLGKLCIKFSTIWHSGVYKFQQIRDEDYDYLVCLGISPHQAHLWFVPKTEVDNRIIGIAGQHRGSSANDTFWLSIDPTYAHAWLNNYGGTIGQAETMLSGLARNV
jgi:hypothetical protein